MGTVLDDRVEVTAADPVQDCGGQFGGRHGAVADGGHSLNGGADHQAPQGFPSHQRGLIGS
jgi:hypothetical protein